MKPAGARRRVWSRAPKAVLFDLDGTLFDHPGAVLDALTEWLPTVGLVASPEVLDRWFDAEELYMGRWRAGQVSWQEQRRLRLQMVVPALEQAGEADLDAIFGTYLSRYESGWRVYDDVVVTLTELASRGLRLGVLTNGATAQQHAKLATLGLVDRFEFVLTSEDLGVAKPDPIVYLTACDRFGLPAGEVVHVGDVPDLDVVGARAAGLHAVLIDRENQYQQAGSLRSLRGLPGWIAAIAQVGSAPDRPAG